MKKTFYMYGSLVLLVLLTLGVTFAAFTDKANFAGSSISVASSDIKLLDVYNGGIDPSNLVDSKPGPTFTNIYSGWAENYVVQIYNNGSSDLRLSSKAEYQTANDPAELRQVTYIEIFEWADENGDGIPQQEEYDSHPLGGGRKQIIKWNTQGFDLGILPKGQVRTLVLRFSADSVSPTKQGASMIFDFSFDATGM